MDEFEPAVLTELIGRIYEAAIDSRQWDDFVALLGRFYPDTRITLFGHENGRPSDALTVRWNFAPDDLRAYVDHHIKSSPHLARVDRVPLGRAVDSESVIEEREFLKTEHYNDFTRPRRLGYHATGIVLERGRGRMTALSLANWKNDPDQRERQLRLLDLLAPHLLRAFRLHRGLVERTAGGEAAKAAFDSWTHAAFVLNAAGRVMSYNQAAEALLRRRDGLALCREGRLLSADEAQTREIEIAARKCGIMANTAKPDIGAAELDGIVLPRPSGGAPLRAMIWPLPFLGTETAPRFARGTALLVILDPDHVQCTPVGWLARQYRLSPAEERLTEAIVNGVPLAEAAEQFGIRLSTARQRLKDIQAKTQCRRQIDLVRLALSLPEFRAAEG
jgi:DNA-binding CsgD family transcriptional regulator/PAS domain-containing protein